MVKHVLGLQLFVVFMIVSAAAIQPRCAWAQDAAINMIKAVVVADPMTGFVYVNETVSFSRPVTGTIGIPLINASSYTLLGAYSGGEPVPALLDEEQRTVYVTLNGSDTLWLNYTVTGLFDELVPGTGIYEASADTLWWGVEDSQYILVLPKGFNVTVSPEYRENNILYTENNTIIVLRKPSIYYIVLYPSQEPQPPEGGGGAGSGGTGGAGGTGGGGEAAGGAGGGVPGNETGGAVKGGEEGFPWLYAAIAVAAAAAAVGAGYVFLRRRGRSIDVEVVTIPSTDILRDETARGIIVVVGDAGKEGVKQSRIVSVLGKPKSTISRRIKRLEEDGFIEVERAGRHNYVRLTEKGWEAYRRIIEEERRGGGEA